MNKLSFKLALIRALLGELLALVLRRSSLGLKLLRTYNYARFRKNLKKLRLYREAKSFKELPVADKTFMMRNFADLNVKGIEADAAFKVGLQAERGERPDSLIGDVSVGLSSGTSGNRGVFLVSAKERAAWVASIFVRVLGLSFKSRKVAFFLRANNELYESSQSSLLQFKFYNIFNSLEGAWADLQSYQPDVIVAQPSVFDQLLQLSGLDEIPWQIEKAISVAEVLSPEDESKFSKWLKRPIGQVYQCTEGFLAHTCSKGSLHWNSDRIIIEKEALDDKRFLPIITDLKRSTQMMVRYRMNDIIIPGKCDCGLKTEVIESIEGRADDIFIWERNGELLRVFPDYIRRALVFSDDSIQDYTVCKVPEGIELWIDGPLAAQENGRKALQEILQKLDLVVPVTLVEKPWRATNGKRKRVIDLSVGKV